MSVRGAGWKMMEKKAEVSLMLVLSQLFSPYQAGPDMGGVHEHCSMALVRLYKKTPNPFLSQVCRQCQRLFICKFREIFYFLDIIQKCCLLFLSY